MKSVKKAPPPLLPDEVVEQVRSKDLGDYVTRIEICSQILDW